MDNGYDDNSEGFDPSQHKPDPSKGKGDDNFLERAGTYLLAFTWKGELKENKNGKLNARFKVEVIAEVTNRGLSENEAGSIFFDSVYFIPSTYERLGALCAAMGVTEAFKFTDEQVGRALLWRPFKSSVKIESSDGRKFAKLGYVKPDVSPEERAAMEQWIVEAMERREAERSTGGDEFGGSDLRDPGGPRPPDDSDLDGW